MFPSSCGDRRSPLCTCCSPHTSWLTLLLLRLFVQCRVFLSLLTSPLHPQHERCGLPPPPAPPRVRSSQFVPRSLLYTPLSLLHCVRSGVGTLILDGFLLLSLPWFSSSSTSFVLLPATHLVPFLLVGWQSVWSGL